jgi:hypothetical protein
MGAMTMAVTSTKSDTISAPIRLGAAGLIATNTTAVRQNEAASLRAEIMLRTTL